MSDAQNQAGDDRKLVCHIIHRLDYGGLENGLVNLINWMPADRYRHAILCLTNATDFRERIARRDVRILEVRKRQGKDIRAYGRVYRLLRELKPWIVHTRNLPAVDMTFTARMAGIRRIVHSEHGLDLADLNSGARRYDALRRLSRIAVLRYLTVSADLQRWLAPVLRMPTERVEVIYNGVDVSRFRPAFDRRFRLPTGFDAPGTFVIGTIGRFEPIKDQLTLAHACAKLLTERRALRNRVRLIMIGDGTRRGVIEDVLGRAGIRELAWMPGFREDVADLYRCMDVFVLPSRREGISNTALEAMATGLPVIATRVGGNPEVVEDGETGQLVPVGDPDALSDAIYKYIENATLASAHGEHGRLRVAAHFSPAAMVRGYLSVYDSLA